MNLLPVGFLVLIFSWLDTRVMGRARPLVGLADCVELVAEAAVGAGTGLLGCLCSCLLCA